MPRPATYRREEVVELAALRFWEEGFAACDVETLTQAAGVNRHSLYKAFGGKAGLFLAALEHYLAAVSAPYLAVLEEGGGLDDLVAYFEMATGTIGGASGRAYDRRGCLITNTVGEMGRSDPQVSAIVDRYYDRLERAFAGLVARGQAGGSIRPGIDPGATARWLLITAQGMSVSARRGSVPADLPGIIRAALQPG